MTGKTNVDANILSGMPLEMDKYCTKEVINATIETVREQSKGTTPWVRAITADMTTSEPALKRSDHLTSLPKVNQGGAALEYCY